MAHEARCGASGSSASSAARGAASR
jgi:hypothetical protein